MSVLTVVLATLAGARSEPTGTAGPNVLFVLIDTLRADHLSAYGYPRKTSPTIDRLAETGVRFERVRSQASWTKPSMASLWTSIHPSGTGVLRFSHGLPDEATLPAEILRAAGYRTGGVWRNGWVAPNFGFGQGFDLYVRPPPSPEVRRRGAGSGERPFPTDADLTASALEFLRTFRDQPFLLYVHYMDVHQYVYDPESALFGTGYADAYDNAIHWVDANLAALVAELEALGLYDDTLIVIAADHGEEFGDHGSEGHGRTLYHEVTQVPLVLSQPARLPSGVVVPQWVQNLDLWPTVLELLGRTPLPQAQGRSLVAAIERSRLAGPRDVPAEPVTETFSQIDRVWGRRDEAPRPLVSVTRGDWRLIRPLTPPGGDLLFDLAADPEEKRDLAVQEPDLVKSLGLRIETLLERPAPWSGADEVELDAIRLEQLRALGYIGVGRHENQPSDQETTQPKLP